MYFNEYVKYKTRYMNAKKIYSNKQIGTARKLLNEDKLLEDGMSIKFTFTPELYKLDKNGEFVDDPHPIKATPQNKINLLKFMKSKRGKSFLDYCFNDLRPYYLPFYTPEMYYIDKRQTNIKESNGIINIIITGTIKKKSYEYVKEHYNKSFALNKTWNDEVKEKFKVKHFYDLVKDAFYKDTNEGEIHIPNIGQLELGVRTKMKLEIIR